MRIIQFCLYILITISSCKVDYGDELLIKDLESNNSSRIIDNFFEKHKLEKEEFQKTVEIYSKYIGKNHLKRIPFEDFNPFKKRKRYGYIYLDDKNNFIASMTYKFVMQKDSSLEVNYIDFRNSTSELPCVKFPTKFPIKCVALPMPPAPDLSSINLEYPKDMDSLKIYHFIHASKERVSQFGDTLKRVLAFNTGNGLIGDNFTELLGEIDNKMGLEYYTLFEAKKIGEPVINIIYDPNVHPDYEVDKINEIIRKITGASTRLKAHKTRRLPWANIEPMISIGFPLSESQVKYYR